MEKLSRLFKKKIKGKKYRQQDAINRDIDSLKIKNVHIERKIEQEQRIAKENVLTNKELALAALKRKKELKKQLEDNDDEILRLENQADDLENAEIDAIVRNTLKFAAVALNNFQVAQDDAHDALLAELEKLGAIDVQNGTHENEIFPKIPSEALTSNNSVRRYTTSRKQTVRRETMHVAVCGVVSHSFFPTI